MTAFGPVISLPAWWPPELPKIGQFICSGRRARYAYEIVELRNVRPAPMGAHKMTLRVLRWRPAEVPEGATVWPWRWNKR